MPTDIRKIKSLIELVEKSSITTLEISEDGETIKISRATDASTAPAPIVIPMMTGSGYYPAQNQAPQYQSSGSAASSLQVLTPQAPAAPTAPAPVAAQPTPEKTPEPSAPAVVAGHTVKSPMVGTYYSSPSPEAEPFVTIGSKVSVGDTLCIIEAMKMLNRIESDKAGVVQACLSENGKAVEYDQPLFIIG